MAYFVGLDVSVKETSVCVVDDSGKVISEQKVLTEPDNIITLLTSIGETYADRDRGRSAVAVAGQRPDAADLPVICVETRHMKALLTAQQLTRRTAMMRVGSRR